MKLICQKWEESERGWGTRPDGYSLHLSLADLHKYIQEHNDKLPPEPPDEYSRPCGKPYECEVTDPLVLAMIKHDGHMRSIDNRYPEPTDGSKPTGWANFPDGGVGRLPSDEVQTFAVDGLKVEELYLPGFQAAEEHAHLFPDEYRAVILKRLLVYFMVHAEGVRLVQPISEERLNKLKASYPNIEQRLPKRLLFLDDLVKAAVHSQRVESLSDDLHADLRDRVLRLVDDDGILSPESRKLLDEGVADAKAGRVVPLTIDPAEQPSDRIRSRVWEVSITQIASDKDQQRLFCERLRKVADDIEAIPPGVFKAFYAQPGGRTGGMCGAPATLSMLDLGYKGVWSTREDDE